MDQSSRLIELGQASMFGIVKRLARYYLSKPIVLQPGATETWLKAHEDVTIITSPSAKSSIESIISKNRYKVFLDPPIEVSALDALVPEIKTSWIAGIGAGRVMDVSKYLALRSKCKLCLIPAVLSTTSWLNMAIALRKNNILHFPGTKHATTTIVDPDFILKAPISLSLGGLADILASCSALTDWEIAGEKVGEKVSLHGIAAFKTLIEKVLSQIETYKKGTADSINLIYETFLEALSLCGASFSGRPVEGSEHFLFYLAEETCQKRFVHGEIIALMTLVSLQLQGARAIITPDRLRNFFDGLSMKYAPSDLDIDRDEMNKILSNASRFTMERKLEYTILNADAKISKGEVDLDLLDWIYAL